MLQMRDGGFAGYWGCGMLMMLYVEDVGYPECEMLGMCGVGDGAVGDVGFWGCGMLGMWNVQDVGCWDVGCWGCGVLEM